MEIGMVEILCHHVFLYSLASVAKESGASVTIFTTKNLYDLVAPLFKDKIINYRWVIKDEDEKIHDFLKRVNKLAEEELDLLFINTLQGIWYYPAYFLFKPKCKSILVTGRATDWFGSKYQLNLFKDIKYSLIHNATHFMTKKVLPRYDAILVHTQTLKDYVLKYGYKKNIFVLPFSIYEGNRDIKKTKKIKFIVTGSIAEHRRDYDSLLKAFEKIWTSGYKNVCLTILGRPIGEYGERIINWCRPMKEHGFDIQFYNEYISEEIYKDEIASANVIINPIKLGNYSYGGFTAGLVEAIRYAKPGVYPFGYVVPNKLLSSSLFYNKIEELPNLIEYNFINNRESLKRLSQNAIINSEHFSLQKVTKYFQECVIKKLLTL